MKTKFTGKVKQMVAKYKLGDFFRNFIAVILGIIITFIGNDLIQDANKEREVKQALQLVKSELLLNKEIIEEMRETEILNKKGALYILQFQDNMDEAQADSLAYYGYFPFQSRDFLPVTNALEMLKGSLIQNIKSKELVVQIIQAYAVIQNSHMFYEGYAKAKDKGTEGFTTRQDYLKFANKPASMKERWDFILRLPEGLAAIQQLSQVHDNPYITYGHHLEMIDDAIAAIDKEYN